MKFEISILARQFLDTNLILLEQMLCQTLVRIEGFLGRVLDFQKLESLCCASSHLVDLHLVFHFSVPPKYLQSVSQLTIQLKEPSVSTFPQWEPSVSAVPQWEPPKFKFLPKKTPCNPSLDVANLGSRPVYLAPVLIEHAFIIHFQSLF